MASQSLRRGRSLPALAALAVFAVASHLASLTFGLVQPKRPLSPYLLWAKKNQAKVAKELGTKDVAEVAKVLGEKWGKVTAAQKKKLTKQHEAAWKDYEVEVADFIASGGVITSPNAPKRPLNPFFLWAKDNRAKVARELNMPINWPNVTMALGERWGKVSAAEKKKLTSQYEAAWKAYQGEEYEFLVSGGNIARQNGKAKVAKDPKAPKRPLTPFFLWAKDNRAKVATKLGTTCFAEVSKALSERWGKVSALEKYKYSKIAEEGRSQYAKDLAKYRAKLVEG